MKLERCLRNWMLRFGLAIGLGLVCVAAQPAGAQVSENPGLSGMLLVQTVSGGPIYVVDAAGGEARYLVDGIDPALSPDGQWVAFTRWSSSQHGALGALRIVSIDGGQERVVLDGVAQPKSPTWSPDGSQIALAMQQGGRLQPEHKCSHEMPSEPLIADPEGDYLRVVTDIDADGVDIRYCYTLLPHPYWGLQVVDVATGDVQGVPHDRFSSAPAWDPQNDWRLVYAGEKGLVNLDTKLGTTWAMTDDGNDHGPVFSPDGTRVAVSYWQHDHWDIHLLNSDGGGRTRLTATPLRELVEQRLNGQPERAWNNAAPTWSPDGGYIAFLSDRSGRWDVWVMNVYGGDQRPLVAAGLMLGSPLTYDGMDERVLSWR